MKKLIALLVTAFAVATCVITGPPPNNHSVSPRTDSTSKIVVPDTVDLAQKNVFASDTATSFIPTSKPLGSAIDVASVRSAAQKHQTSLVESARARAAVNHQTFLAWWNPAPDWPDAKVA